MIFYVDKGLWHKGATIFSAERICLCLSASNLLRKNTKGCRKAELNLARNLTQFLTTLQARNGNVIANLQQRRLSEITGFKIRKILSVKIRKRT
jgi:hypothetical protein